LTDSSQTKSDSQPKSNDETPEYLKEALKVRMPNNVDITIDINFLYDLLSIYKVGKFCEN